MTSLQGECVKNMEEISVLDKRVRLRQPPDGFRTSLDSVMLAAACPVKPGQRVLDMGCGVGGAMFCVLERVQDCHVTGIDIQADYVALAQDNAILNDAEDKVRFIIEDIRAYDVGDPKERFDHMICNPPFLEAGQHLRAPDAGKATARGHETNDISIKDWVDAGFRNLKPGGSITFIHRADAVDRIIYRMGKRFGAIEIIPLWPKQGKPAKRVIIRALKDRKTPATIHPGIVLHDEEGAYTAEAEAILREVKYI